MSITLKSSFNGIQQKLAERRQNRWVSSITSGKRDVKQVQALCLIPGKDDSYYMQSFTELAEGDAVAIALSSGERGLFRSLEHSKVYNDFGTACYSVRVQNTGLVVNLGTDAAKSRPVNSSPKN